MFTKYIKGGLKATIIKNTSNGNVTYIASTPTKSKNYKTFKGAEKFMAKNNYKKEVTK